VCLLSRVRGKIAGGGVRWFGSGIKDVEGMKLDLEKRRMRKKLLPLPQ